MNIEQLPVRIASKIAIESDNGCWLWTASSWQGYGQVSWQGRPVKAHRLIYKLLVGPVPEGMTLDHLCRKRACVNPAHLEPVSHQVNLLRGEGFPSVNARKTHCIHGHEFTVENTGRNSLGRYCRSCHNASSRRWYASRRILDLCWARED